MQIISQDFHARSESMLDYYRKIVYNSEQRIDFRTIVQKGGVYMSYKYIDSEKIEKKKRSSAKFSGICAIIIGVLFAAGGIFFLAALGSAAGMLVMLIFTLIFVGAGIYFFNQVNIEEKKSRALDDPNSSAYRKRQQQNAKKREKFLRKAEKHGTLKSILCRRAALIWGISMLVVWLLSAVMFLIGIIIFIMPVLDVMMLILFISSLFGKQYKTMLQGYAEFGMDRAEAEADFAQSRAYLVGTDVIAVSPKFLIATAEYHLLPVDQIVWIYSGYDNIHQYKSGMYSHTERKYSVIVSLADGQQEKISCPEELCAVIMEDAANAGTAVTVGYAPELPALYAANPEAFRSAFKNLSTLNTDPIGPQ